MNTSEQIKQEIKSLLNKQSELFDLAQKPKDIPQFGNKYQNWYSRAYKAVAKELIAREKQALEK